MGQSFYLISIDNLQISLGGAKFGEFFWEEDDDIILRLIAPVIPPSYLESDGLTQRSTWAESAPLLNLPPELLLLVAEHLTYADVISLSLICPTMWTATSHIRYLSLSTKLQHQSWAGSRLICLGDYAEDLPTGFITSSDLEQMDEILGYPTISEDSDDGPRELALFYRFYQSYCSRPERYLTICGPTERRRSFLDFFYTPYIPRRVSDWVSLEERCFVPKPKPEDCWMLRNLSKKEFVIKAKHEGRWHGLIQALYTLITWSNDPSISMACEDEVSEAIIRGPWAGDRIDVTLKSIHDSEQEGQCWKNITARVAGVVDSLGQTDHWDNNFKFDEDD
ncbi:hypothetical protein BT96DRAFT_1017232 [Gymnopus androsaceus JB14]|uniref:F-box domain-containing protein n=1 Tax=Gymnopus androsaceus JB14 TaxID=1447944 RepID=A0A6A4I1A8_9AGAR|nr:hypothetical protein BT96DRAFT_1017232 [Gymnopus androsaceus JB14]